LGLGTETELPKFDQAPESSPPKQTKRKRKAASHDTKSRIAPRQQCKPYAKIPAYEDAISLQEAQTVTLTESSGPVVAYETLTPNPTLLETTLADDGFDDGIDDDDLLAAATDSSDILCSSNQMPVASFPAQNSVHTLITGSSTLICDTSPTTLDDAGKHAHKLSITMQDPQALAPINMKPIVRSPFPTPVRDRSPVIGLTPNTLLRTCFRIGEAINAGCGAVKSGKSVLLELYARVLSSERTDLKQHFIFCDLFHSKPPYINAEYAASIWAANQLFEYDSRRLMRLNSIVRCVGKMKRDGKGWVLTVLNAWEATPEDVRWVEGIVKA
jgi:hypothetical protein